MASILHQVEPEGIRNKKDFLEKGYKGENLEGKFGVYEKRTCWIKYIRTLSDYFTHLGGGTFGSIPLVFTVSLKGENDFCYFAAISENREGVKDIYEQLKKAEEQKPNMFSKLEFLEF